MRNLIITIALILCIFVVFMGKLNYEASTIPEVEEWIYTTYWYNVEAEIIGFIDEVKYYDALIQIELPLVISGLGWEGSVILRIISEDKRDTTEITREMVELFEKLFLPKGER